MRHDFGHGPGKPCADHAGKVGGYQKAGASRVRTGAVQSARSAHEAENRHEVAGQQADRTAVAAGKARQQAGLADVVCRFAH